MSAPEKSKRRDSSRPHGAMTLARRRPAALVGAVLVVFALSASVLYFLFSREQGSLEAGRLAAPRTRSAGFESTPEMAEATAPLVQVQLEVLPTEDSRTASDDLQEALDPGRDGWDTEALHEATSAQLGRIGQWLTSAEQLPAGGLGTVAADEFACGPLRPGAFSNVSNDPSIVVRRAGDLPADDELPTYVGKDGLSGALQAATSSLAGAEQRRVKFKQFHIDASGTSLASSAYFQAAGKRDEGRVQINATWDCQWTRPAENEPPRLKSLRVRDFEEVELRDQANFLFADCTESVCQADPCYKAQLCHGTDYWLKRIEARYGNSYHGNHGLAVGDVNGDGLEDVYLCQMGTLPNRLLIHQPDGTIQDRSAWAGVDFLDYTAAALFADLDNDGDQDLVVATSPQLLILANDGRGRFKLVGTPHYVRGATSLAAADYDDDGDVDIYVCVYWHRDEDGKKTALPVPYHDANNGLPNWLFRNDGKLTFTDATSQAGLDENNKRFSFAAAWEDYDNDGDIDLYVANDFGRNNLYRNDNGRFTDVAAPAGVEDVAAGMSVTWGDYNRDGRMDLYVSNMYSSAGSRVAYQRRFLPDSDQATRSLFQRHARGNSLFENLAPPADSSGPAFLDVSAEAAVVMGRWAWASLFVDINNDGWEDLMVANGMRTGDTADDL